MANHGYWQKQDGPYSRVPDFPIRLRHAGLSYCPKRLLIEFDTLAAPFVIR